MIRSTTALLLPLILYTHGQLTCAAVSLINTTLTAHMQLMEALSTAVLTSGRAPTAKRWLLNPLNLVVWCAATPTHKKPGIYISDCITFNLYRTFTPRRRFSLIFKAKMKASVVQGAA